MNYRRIALCASLAACLCVAAFAQSAEEIITKMEGKFFTDGKSVMQLVFIDEAGKKDVYRMVTYARDRNQRIIVRSTAPASSVGNDLLMLERNVWLFDASTDRTLKIPSNQSFGGSDFSYGDVVRLNFSDNYVPVIVSALPEGGWTLDLQAKERDAPYYRIRLTISAAFLPVRGTCYARSGDVIKEIVYGNVRDAGSGAKPLSITVTSPLHPGRTNILTVEKETPKRYPEQIFNKRNLSARLEEQF